MPDTKHKKDSVPGSAGTVRYKLSKTGGSTDLPIFF